MKNITEWNGWLQMAFIFGSLLLIAALVFWRDAWRKKEENNRVKNPDLANKWSTNWHMISAILYGTAAVLFAFSIYGIDWRVLSVLGLATAARWIADPVWNLVMGLDFFYTGSSAKTDQMLGGGKWKMIIVKAFWLFANILVAYFVFI